MLRFTMVAVLVLSGPWAGAVEKGRLADDVPEAAARAFSPLAAVDSELRQSHGEYIGLRVGAKGSVRLTVSRKADRDSLAQLARETWLKAAASDQDLPPIEFNVVEPDAEQLNKAFGRLRGVLSFENVGSIDLDEACGCIAIGVIRKEAISRVREYVAVQRVPMTWVVVDVRPAAIRKLDLQDRFRPTMGGIRIQTTGGTCSLGLPVYSFTRQKKGFLTASHCSNGNQGDLDSTLYFQRSSNNNYDAFAEEDLDLPMFDSTVDPACPANRLCRYSDVSFNEYWYSANHHIGRVKKPATECVAAGTACSLTVARHTDDIRIAMAIAGLFTGSSIDKVGQTSGWTRGDITNTCVDVNVFDEDANGNAVDTNKTLLCQHQVDTTAMPGDSGSPVFEYHAGAGVGVFAGILWGGALDHTSMFFSPVQNIDRELGGFVYNQAGVYSPFWSSGQFYTSDVDDRLSVTVEPNVMPADVVEFVLRQGGANALRKEIVLVEGAQAGIGRWPVVVGGTVTSARDGLYTYQLPGGVLEFRKDDGGAMVEVTRVPIDLIPGGTRIIFTWSAD